MNAMVYILLNKGFGGTVQTIFAQTVSEDLVRVVTTWLPGATVKTVRGFLTII
jgi:hypothetical protein